MEATPDGNTRRKKNCIGIFLFLKFGTQAAWWWLYSLLPQRRSWFEVLAKAFFMEFACSLYSSGFSFCTSFSSKNINLTLTVKIAFRYEYLYARVLVMSWRPMKAVPSLWFSLMTTKGLGDYRFVTQWQNQKIIWFSPQIIWSNFREKYERSKCNSIWLCRAKWMSCPIYVSWSSHTYCDIKVECFALCRYCGNKFWHKLQCMDFTDFSLYV